MIAANLRWLRLRAARLSLLTALLLLAVKFIAYWSTGSAAVLSDALESIVNVVAAAFLVYSIQLSAKPADSDHPYGHGKVEDFAAGVEGALIVIAAVGIGFAAVPRFFAPRALEELSIGLLLVTVATLVNLWLGLYLRRLGRRAHSRALLADGTHLLTDVVTSVGALLALLLVRWTGQLWIDPLIACVLALQILFSGAALVRGSIGRLMDEADEELLARLASVLETGRRVGWVDIHHLRAWQAGDLAHVDLHLTLPRFWKVEDAHREADALHTLLAANLGQDASIMVHSDPCRPRDCASCDLANCGVRDDSFASRKQWTRDHLTAGPHALDEAAPAGPQDPVR